jgi:hypothetical protein
MKVPVQGITIVLVIVCAFASAQKTTKITGVSNRIFISIGNEASKPPVLEIRDLYYEDLDGNKMIDADESASIQFDLHNTGTGPGTGLEIIINEKNKVPGLWFEKSIPLQDVKEKDKIHCTIPVKGLTGLSTGTALFIIEVKEKNGFHAKPLQIEVVTEAFLQPLVKVVSFEVSSQNSGMIEKRKPFDLQLQVKNLGQGTAREVTVSLQMPVNVFCLSANQSETIGLLDAGEKKLLTYNLVTNNEFNSQAIDLRFKLNEKYGKFAEDTSIRLVLNQKIPLPCISVIDCNIPEISPKNPYKVALIIGNENYSGLNAEINVEYARRDAETFREYALKTLGVEEKNLRLILDATSGTMHREIDLVTELVKRMGPEAELILYYAGHGFPDENTKIPYLIPVDVNAANLSSAVPLNDVYRKLGSLNAKKITVFLDACFSGGGRNQGLLSARGVRIKPKEETVTGNTVVFSAATGEQSALPFHDQKHGMFSYFLMKKIQETKGKVTYGELFKDVFNSVRIESVRINEKPQDPELIFSPSISDNWKNLTF